MTTGSKFFTDVIEVGCRPARWRSRRALRRGFSFIELLVVLAVAIMLTGIMLPAMSQLKESAHRIVCSSNERQQGQALFMYAHDHKDRLPKSAALSGPEKVPQELMRAINPETKEWDGWGILYHDRYCAAVECYYCPSHLGEHPIDRYYEEWIHPTGNPIYTNYHYAGDREWDSNKVRSLDRGSEQALAADGLRTASDVNHLTGMNILYADGSVRWLDDAKEIIQRLPVGELSSQQQAAEYIKLWALVEFRR